MKKKLVLLFGILLRQMSTWNKQFLVEVKMMVKVKMMVDVNKRVTMNFRDKMP